jgi:hypothetical protein
MRRRLAPLALGLLVLAGCEQPVARSLDEHAKALDRGTTAITEGGKALDDVSKSIQESNEAIKETGEALRATNEELAGAAPLTRMVVRAVGGVCRSIDRLARSITASSRDLRRLTLAVQGPEEPAKSLAKSANLLESKTQAVESLVNGPESIGEVFKQAAKAHKDAADAVRRALDGNPTTDNPGSTGQPSTLRSTLSDMKTGLEKTNQGLGQLSKDVPNLTMNITNMGQRALDLAVLTLTALVVFLSQWSRDVVEDAEDKDAKRRGDPILCILCYLLASTVICYIGALYFWQRLDVAAQAKPWWFLGVPSTFLGLYVCMFLMVICLVLMAGYAMTTTGSTADWPRCPHWLRLFAEECRSLCHVLPLVVMIILVVPCTLYCSKQIQAGDPELALYCAGIGIYTMISTGVFIVAFRDDLPRVIKAVEFGLRSTASLDIYK